MNLNQYELRAVVTKHCGEKLAKGERICDPCYKKMDRARRIEKQIDRLWRLHDTGMLDRPWGYGERRDDREHQPQPRQP